MGGVIGVFESIIFAILSLYLTGYILIKLTSTKMHGIRLITGSALLSICISIIVTFLLALMGAFSAKTVIISLLSISLIQYLIIITKNGKSKSKRDTSST